MTDTPYNSINQFSGGVRSCNEQRAEQTTRISESFHRRHPASCHPNRFPYERVAAEKGF